MSNRFKLPDIHFLDVSMPTSPAVLFSRLVAKARLKHLQLLTFIGDLDNLQRAASMVGMSQPAATHALAELEALIGAPLFERHSRGMRPTAVGRALLPAVKTALRAMQDGAEAVATTRMGAAGSLKVGSIGAGISGILQVALPTFSENNPEVTVEVMQIEAEELLSSWDRLGLDVLLCRLPQECPAGSRFVPLVSDRYCIVASPDHPLANREVVDLMELHGHAWLMQPPRSIASRDFYALWERCESSPPLRWINSRSMLLMLAMLQRQPLLSFIPLNAVRQILDSRLLIEIDTPLTLPLPAIGALYRIDAAGENRGLAALMDVMVAAGDMSGHWR